MRCNDSSVYCVGRMFCILVCVGRMCWPTAVLARLVASVASVAVVAFAASVVADAADAVAVFPQLPP